MNKKMLLIAGGGTLGRYTAEQLLADNCEVDVICLEDYVSNNKMLCYYKAKADLTYLENFLKDKYYDGIVNFIHYTDAEEYKPVHKYLCGKCGHLVFLSSYRVYADLQHPITETAPQLYDVSADEEFLAKEDYAVPKSKCEKFIRDESGTKNWSIVRPVISFSERRLDLVTVSGREIPEKVKQGKKILLPRKAKNLTAGLDWAGNSGKLIAKVVQSDKTLGEEYTISTAQNLLWSEVADLYTEILGAKFEWVDTETYVKNRYNTLETPWILKYDRFFDRKTDCSKVFEVTGLKREDFKSIKQGILIELDKINAEV